MINKLPDELAKLRDEQSEEQGNRHANPVIRSMYPTTSRGEMSSQFAQLHTLGFDSGAEAMREYMQVEMDKLVGVVEFYADVHNWESPSVINDPDHKAAKALASYRARMGEKK